MSKLKETVSKVAAKVAHKLGNNECNNGADKPCTDILSSNIYKVGIKLSEKMYNKEVNRYLFVNPFTDEVAVSTINDVQLETTTTDYWRLFDGMRYRGYYDSITITLIK